MIWISPGLPADAERDLGSLYIFLAPLFLGLGAVAGPATIGLVADRRGLGAALLLAAAVAIATVLARPGGAAGQPGGQRGGQPAGAG